MGIASPHGAAPAIAEWGGGFTVPASPTPPTLREAHARAPSTAGAECGPLPFPPAGWSACHPALCATARGAMRRPPPRPPPPAPRSRDLHRRLRATHRPRGDSCQRTAPRGGPKASPLHVRGRERAAPPEYPPYFPPTLLLPCQTEQESTGDSFKQPRRPPPGLGAGDPPPVGCKDKRKDSRPTSSPVRALRASTVEVEASRVGTVLLQIRG